jgi:hypothetical protein
MLSIERPSQDRGDLFEKLVRIIRDRVVVRSIDRTFANASQTEYRRLVMLAECLNQLFLVETRDSMPQE